MNDNAHCLPATSAPVPLASPCLKGLTTPVGRPSDRYYPPDSRLRRAPQAPKTQHWRGFAPLAADHRSREAHHVGTTACGNP